MMFSLQPVLIAGEWRQALNPVGAFTAVNPATRLPLPDKYPVSGLDDVEAALCAAQQAVTALRVADPEAIARFLELFADAVEADADILAETANLETALPCEPRLKSAELPRTTNQLRQAAAAARDRSWRHAVIDTAAGIRSMHGPLGGPVVVFGPNNFPFAFNSVAGGDFAAAIAAGNPVIAKANSSHPATTKRLAEAALHALHASGLPDGMVQLLYRTPPDVGFRLVSDRVTGATGFTGSRAAGLRLKTAADRAGKPIYLEMSSVNPVFVLPGALEERWDAIAAELYSSCALGAGQFCTNPGLVVVQEGESADAFVREAARLFRDGAPGTLLGEQGPRGIAAAIQVLREHGADVVVGGSEAESRGYAFANTLLRSGGRAFLANPDALQTEAFGTVSLVVVAKDTAQMVAIAAAMEGNLTGCLYSHTQGLDDGIYDQVAPVLRHRVGRLLNDKMPTGVAVSPAMNHGGPYPATGHPGFTAVGIPSALIRFTALHAYDNVRPHRLPSELRDRNPTGSMWRLIDLNWTRDDVHTS